MKFLLFILFLFINKILDIKRHLHLGFKKKIESDIYVNKYIKFNKKKFKEIKNLEDKFIFTDILAKPRSIIPNSILINYLHNKYKFKLATFGRYKRTVNDELYKSFNVNKHFEIKLNIKELFSYFKLFKYTINNISSKKDLFNFKIENMSIGVDIYESILKNGNPTIEINTIVTKYYIFLGIINFLYLKKLILKKKIKLCLLSHDCYLECGILSKLAIKYKIPLIYANDREINFSNREFDLYDRYKRYPLYFKYLVKNKKKSIEISKKTLNKRLSGEVGVKMPYQEKSAFHNEKKETNILSKKKNIKILILTHCFFDNPHSLGKMNYEDFYEWLNFLKQISKKSQCEWYIKPHRDYLSGTLETIKKIIKDSNIKLLSPDVSFHQLKSENLNYAITCYGSAGHELPLIGIDVINSSYNPHVSYKFNHHLVRKKELRNFLINLNKNKRKAISKVSKNQIYEFFYVHKFLIARDDYFFDSFEKFYDFSNHDLYSSKGYIYFIKKHKTIIKNYLKNIEISFNKKSKYSVESNLPEYLQEKININV